MMNSDPKDFERLFPKEDYDKKTFSFSKEEYASLMTYHTIKTMGEMAGILIDNMLNGMCLPRVGIPVKKGVGTIYDAANGTFVVYVPKQWCSACKEAAATTQYDSKFYCETCLPLAQIKEEVRANIGDKQSNE